MEGAGGDPVGAADVAGVLGAAAVYYCAEDAWGVLVCMHGYIGCVCVLAVEV